jgi:hypothetical protein
VIAIEDLQNLAFGIEQVDVNYDQSTMFTYPVTIIRTSAGGFHTQALHSYVRSYKRYHGDYQILGLETEIRRRWHQSSWAQIRPSAFQ